MTAFMMKIISTSADGEEELSDWPDFSDLWDDIVLPLFLVIGTTIFCFAPAIIYLIVIQLDIVFLSLIALGMLYFPMALIAISIFNSLKAVNPLLIVPAILKVPVDYLVACVILGFIVVIEVFGKLLFSIIPFVGLVIQIFLSLYFLIVEARVLGLIYHANREKLGWF